MKCPTCDGCGRVGPGLVWDRQPAGYRENERYEAEFAGLKIAAVEDGDPDWDDNIQWFVSVETKEPAGGRTGGPGRYRGEMVSHGLSSATAAKLQAELYAQQLVDSQLGAAI